MIFRLNHQSHYQSINYIVINSLIQFRNHRTDHTDHTHTSHLNSNQLLIIRNDGNVERVSNQIKTFNGKCDDEYVLFCFCCCCCCYH